jgi:uncharacterized protein
MLGQLDADEIDQVLQSEVVGRLGCHSDGRTYVVPITYVYDSGAIIGRSADGQKLQMMRKNPHICFEVDRVDDLANWRSVIAWGRFEELTGVDADRGLACLFGKLLPLTARSETSQTPKDLTHEQRARVGELKAVVFRIHLTEKTGRFEAAGQSASSSAREARERS